MELPEGSWRVDGPASTARFTVRDKLVSTVRGTLPVRSGSVDLTADGQVEKARVTLDVDGISTGNTKRDRDLKKPRFLDLAAHPVVEVVARSTSARPDGWDLDETLSARGHQAPLSLTATLADGGADHRHVHVTGRLDRSPLRIGAPTFIVGRELDLEVDLEMLSPPVSSG